MKLITRDTDYAIRALMYIANSKKDVVTVTEIEKELNLPRPFLRKILQTLQKGGVLKSKKGNKGGFQLAATSKNIFVNDLINIFQGKITLTECLTRKKICSDIDKCSIRRKIGSIEKKLIFDLKQISIASLLEYK
jgi:Rrf2 family protein